MFVTTKIFSWTRPIASTTTVLAKRHTITRKSFTTSPFSTQHNGLRNVIWTDITDDYLRSVNTYAALLAFHLSNPFQDSKAQNCLITFTADDLYASSTGVPDETRPVLDFYHAASSIVSAELNKIVQAVGSRDPWPVVMRPYFVRRSGSCPIRRYHLAFKVPSSEVPEVLLTRLRAAGLVGGTFFVSTTKKAADEWWFRFLFLLPEEQKYWQTRKD